MNATTSPQAFLVGLHGFLLNSELVQNYLELQISSLTDSRVSRDAHRTIYQNMLRAGNGIPDERAISVKLADIGKVDKEKIWKRFLTVPSHEFRLPHADAFLGKLKEFGTPYIFTQSHEFDLPFQNCLMDNSGFRDVVGPDHLLIENDIVEALPGIITQLRDNGMTRVTIMDSGAPMLDAMLEQLTRKNVPGVEVGWIHKPYGMYEDERLEHAEIIQVHSFDEIFRYTHFDPEVGGRREIRKR